jgi:hypothetical protein
MGSTLLERVVRRELLVSDGKSGSQLERGWLDDGSAIVIKHADIRRDWIMQATGDEGRIARLWAEGVFEQLPDGIDHAMLEVHQTPSGAVIVMRDVSASLFSTGAHLRSGHRRVLRAAAEVHHAFVDRPVASLCPLEACYAFLSPSVCARFADGHEVPRLAIEGWSRFHDIVADDVVQAISAIHNDPARLAAELLALPSTLIHGDLKLANLGEGRGRVIMLDWGTLTTWAPPAVDYAWYLAINGAAIGDNHEQLLHDVRQAAGDADRTALGFALIGALAQLGWEKALAATADDEGTRRRERDGLAWWSAQARTALERWSP